ncbi:MAG TPA: hypothetical protein DCW95_00920, partial [Chryseobacterium sp.]|nr:hypothetical protein [Chryseobacterium sp.]
TDSLILLHGDSYTRMLYFYLKRFTNVHWVCWGSGTKINNSFKSLLSSLLKKNIYNNLRSVIALTEIDKLELKRNFGLSNIYTMPYLGSVDNMQQFKIEDLNKPIKKATNIIYIGNNSSCLPTYNEVVHKLKKYAPAVEVQCMLNYDLNKNEEYDKVERDGFSFFGNKFRFNTEYYELKDYPNYMDKCDIYICNADRQTGLAAIYMTLILGKKLFLTGN